MASFPQLPSILPSPVRLAAACSATAAFCYIRVLKLLRRTVAMAGPNDPVAASIRGMMSRLSVYPFILACVWLLPSINAIVEASRGGRQVFGLALVAQAIAGEPMLRIYL